MAISVYLILFILSFTRSAYAYLDPGTGSMMLQLILGGIAGLLLILKLYWQKLLSFFGITNKKESKKNNNSH